MNSLWAIHLVEYIKPEQETQGQEQWDLYNTVVA